MLEKAARALFDSYVRLSGMDDAEAEPYWLAQKEGFVLSARAALQAIREPEPEVRMIGRNAIRQSSVSPYADYSVSVGQGFTAMIDAILNEKA